MYKILQDFTVPGHKAYKKGKLCKLDEETAKVLVKRGLLALEETKKASKSDEEEEKVEDTKQEEKSPKKAKNNK